LAGKGSVERGCGRGEGGLGAIPDGLVEDPVMSGDEAVQDGQLPCYRRSHRLPVSLPQGRGALDVREQEGDGAAGQISHNVCSALL
jgi:hypothetical protein